MTRATRIFVAVLASGLVAAVMTGCGGSDAASPAMQDAQGVAEIVVNWPAQTDDAGVEPAMIPTETSSIRVTFSDDTGIVKEGVIDRPDDRAQYEVPSQELTVRAMAHPLSSAGGTALARAETVETIPVDDIVQINLELASTIDTIEIAPSPALVDVGGQTQLIATARDADGDAVMVPDEAPYEWTVSEGGQHLGVSATGLLDGLLAGEATVRATEKESGVSGTVAVTVSDPGGGGGNGGGPSTGMIAFFWDHYNDYWVVSADGSGWPRYYEFSNGGWNRASWHPDGTRFVTSKLNAGLRELRPANMQWWECGEGNAPPCIESELVRHWDIVPPRTESSMQDPQWAPDGRHIMYTESDLGERSLWIVDYNYDEPSSSQADLLIDDRQVYHQTWSPDGDMIAFKAREPEDGPWHVFVTDLAGNVQQVTGVSDQPDENEGDFSSPTWSPDGNELAVSRTGAIPNWGIFTVNLNGTGLNQIAGEAVGPRWSPAGDRIAYVNADHNLCTMNPDGTGKRVLLQDYSRWTWSPTGSHIAYFLDLRSEIWVVPAGGGSPQKIFDASHYRDDRLVLDRISWSQ